MTSRERHADRSAVFERDDRTCRHCGAAADDGESTAIRCHPVGDAPPVGDGSPHESSLVTVCERCFAALRGPTSGSKPTLDRDALFRLVRETTRTQGTTVSDVAAFASLATSLPAELEDDAAPDEADPGREYARARRAVRLSLVVVDGRLERLAAIDGTDLEPDVTAALAAVTETARELQSALRAVVERSETVAVGAGRCHGCFGGLEPVPTESDGDPCPTCGLEPHGTAAWRGADGALAFESLFAAITDALEAASAATEELTGRTTALAGVLADERR